jgi:hypothetical protein
MEWPHTQLLGGGVTESSQQQAVSWLLSSGTKEAILVDVVLREEMINSIPYIRTLKNSTFQVNSASQESVRILTVWQCKAAHKCENSAIARFGWTVLPHPTNSPNLAPLDFHQFVENLYAWTSQGMALTKRHFLLCIIFMIQEYLLRKKMGHCFLGSLHHWQISAFGGEVAGTGN